MMFLISRDNISHMPFSIWRLPQLLRFFKTKFDPSSGCPQITYPTKFSTTKNYIPNEIFHNQKLHAPIKIFPQPKITCSKILMTKITCSKITMTKITCSKNFPWSNITYPTKIFHVQKISCPTKIFPWPKISCLTKIFRNQSSMTN